MATPRCQATYSQAAALIDHALLNTKSDHVIKKKNALSQPILPPAFDYRTKILNVLLDILTYE